MVMDAGWGLLRNIIELFFFKNALDSEQSIKTLEQIKRNLTKQCNCSDPEPVCLVLIQNQLTE
jgi:hypothetical protein